LWDDVVDNERHASEPTGGLAVFTPVVCFSINLLSHRLRYGRHTYSTGSSCSAGTGWPRQRKIAHA
jgi:hypothetical protein